MCSTQVEMVCKFYINMGPIPGGDPEKGLPSLPSGPRGAAGVSVFYDRNKIAQSLRLLLLPLLLFQPAFGTRRRSIYYRSRGSGLCSLFKVLRPTAKASPFSLYRSHALYFPPQPTLFLSPLPLHFIFTQRPLAFLPENAKVLRQPGWEGVHPADREHSTWTRLGRGDSED